MGKGEIARYEQFLLFPLCFQKACFPGASKGVIVWEWVKQFHVLKMWRTIKKINESKFNSFSRRQVLDSSKLKEFADDNFKFDKNGRKLSKRVENNVEKEKLLDTSNFSFSHSVFKRLDSKGHCVGWVLKNWRKRGNLMKNLFLLPQCYC